jgi:hypothetical protein
MRDRDLHGVAARVGDGVARHTVCGGERAGSGNVTLFVRHLLYWDQSAGEFSWIRGPSVPTLAEIPMTWDDDPALVYGGPGQRSWDYSASSPEGTLKHRIKIAHTP